MKTVAIESDYVMYQSAINMINILSVTKCRPMILVSRNIKYMQIDIRGGSIGDGASPSSTIRLNDF